MKRIAIVLVLFFIISITSLAIFYLPSRLASVQHSETPTLSSNNRISAVFNKNHILGGFSIDTPEKAMQAASDGVQVVFRYGQPPAESSELGQELRSLHMKVIDGFLSSSLFYYECHRTQTVIPSPDGQGQFCPFDENPSLNSEQALLAVVADHLKQVKANQLILGYWVLDDWAPWDEGSARPILQKIHALIQQYTPGRPAICGFGGSITGWSDPVSANFSSAGCDMVGAYIYGPTIPNTAPTPSPDSYDWSMSHVLPAMFASLKRRGWDISRQPLIGIGQAFGGPRTDFPGSWLLPNARNIATQSKSFCEHGASGIAFYGWSDSAFGPTTQTPVNSAEIQTGIRAGIAACKQYWSSK